MKELTELELHRKLIKAEIKREVSKCKDELRKEFQGHLARQADRIHGQQQWITSISSRLMDLALYENKLINKGDTLEKRNEIMLKKFEVIKQLIQSLHPGLKEFPI